MSDMKPESILGNFNSPSAVRHRNIRHIKDVVMRYIMTAGGISVIVAIVLIAIYLVWVVIPLFLPAHLAKMASYSIPANPGEQTFYYAIEEQREVGMRVSDSGRVVFFKTKSGEVLLEENLLANVDAAVSSFYIGDPTERLIAFGLDNGGVLLSQHNYSVSYPGDVRQISPSVLGLFDGEVIQIDAQYRPITRLAVQSNEDQTTIIGYANGSQLQLVNLTRETGFLSDEVTVVRIDQLIAVETEVDHMIINIEQNELFFSDKQGYLYYYNISNKESPRLLQRVRAVEEGVAITSLEFLSGGISVMVGHSDGNISQWFPVRDVNNNYTLEKIRTFDSQRSPIKQIVPEYYRKGFMALDADGSLGIYHATAHRTIKLQKLSPNIDAKLAISPRANALLIENSDGSVDFWELDNEHPEVSFSSLWGKVWYESREKAEYIWQSSSSSSDFEPKFSLTPLAFGTLKASFYAMLFAIPLSIMGAIYTAYFMSPGVRNFVKPTIEIMAALPTVILGFLAGLWFAPLVEAYLPAMFLMFIVIPVAILITAYGWRCLPEKIRLIIPAGYESLILVPVIVLTTLIVFWSSQPIELWLFDGNLPLWMSQELGISYDQRNSFVVGIAIGFAVIPTIFSISEDAIFGVPRHLTTGSLALGATQWQTMILVILLTASPGIFSAIMIGLGRAVGETMIVVMATGNTAIMDLNIFEGFRALSANIAVEVPESELGSTHYRILFLAGLVLFMATFFFNTIAEVVRQRLRVKYSNL
ncbi:MAG: phosphate transport system permease protein [Gammaproteobacteria bacterium]|jgi:phosphate transport system permease protein